jgi:hypothetical protein
MRAEAKSARSVIDLEASLTDLTLSSESILGAHGVCCRVIDGAGPLSYDAALALMQESERFRDWLADSIRHVEYPALRWETPPITLATLGRPFEFALVSDPFLEMDPEPDVFGPYFANLPPEVDVLAVSNLGRTARLVVPRQLARPEAYVHLKAFLQHAPATQVHSLWRCVAATARAELSNEPLWISTAGGGVSWLHVRIEGEPKYYTYRPYARNDA